jgi:anti-anti-sigma factor
MIKEYYDNLTLILYLEGNLDGNSDHDIIERVGIGFNRDDVQKVYLDLADIKYISSLGIKTLMVLHKRSIKMGKELTLVNIPEKCKIILAMVGILPFFTRENPDSEVNS